MGAAVHLVGGAIVGPLPAPVSFPRAISRRARGVGGALTLQHAARGHAGRAWAWAWQGTGFKTYMQLVHSAYPATSPPDIVGGLHEGGRHEVHVVLAAEALQVVNVLGGEHRDVHVHTCGTGWAHVLGGGTRLCIELECVALHKQLVVMQVGPRMPCSGVPSHMGGWRRRPPFTVPLP